MNDELTELKVKTLEDSIKDIQKQLEKMPDEISKKIDSSVELKITNSVQQVKLDFYKWIVPIMLGLISCFGMIIFNYIK